MLTGEACRAGRGIMNWSMRDLAKEANISTTPINTLENGGLIKEATQKAILEAFERHNIEILNGDQPGARLRQKM